MRRKAEFVIVLSLYMFFNGPLFGAACAQNTFNQVFESVKARPEFAHSFFGVAIYSIDRKTMLYELNGNKLFVPGSTTKLLTGGAALQLLGPDYRFHTPVYRTGVIENGVLKGNLVLVASGDPDLSGRLQPDGTLAFADEDHSYGGFKSRVIGDPLAALKSLAGQVAASGIRKVDGQILVDASFFAQGQRELGTGVTISPIIVNDNVVDVVISPGSSASAPAALRISPQPTYIHFVNQVKTGVSGSPFSLDRSERSLPDGSIEVTLRGSIPPERGDYVSPYPVSDPARFAAGLLTTALEEKGIVVGNKTFPAEATGDTFKAIYTQENCVAELVSAPLREDVKVTLKVS